jgi:uncharacterized protein (DUF1697 family)
VVFRAPAAVAAGLPDRLAAAIHGKTGLTVPVVLRSARELAAVAQANPYLGRDPTTDALHVVFLADRPSAKAIAGLDPARSPPDEYQVVGREISCALPRRRGQTVDQRLLR